MADSLIVSWAGNSEFYREVREQTMRRSRRWSTNDDLEPLPEVWAGLRGEFEEGQILVESEIRCMRTMIRWKVSNYYKSKAGRPAEQFGNSRIPAHPALDSVKSSLDPPDQVAANRELCGMIEAWLSAMPVYRAEAVRSRYGFPGVPEWAEFVRNSGTTRQNLAKHLKKGLEELKRRIT